MHSKMHSTQRSTFGLFNLKILSAAVASAFLFSNVYAAGLGKLTVFSSLGQPLRAEIELTSVSEPEVGTLAAKLASAEAFRQANIDFNSALMSLQFSIEQRAERSFIRVTSPQPLNEPFVDLLLELSSPNGRLIREYTFLLDPVDFRAAQPSQVPPVVVPGTNTARSSHQQGQAAAAASVDRSTPPTSLSRSDVVPQSSAAGVKSNPPSDSYHVRSGDALSRIASQVKPAGISLDQMLVALYQANPDAFVGRNMNRLKAGQILSIPDAETVGNLNKADARNIIVAHAADFNSYRAQLAGKAAAATAQKSGETKQSAGGKITANVEERQTPVSESKDKLKLSNAIPAAGSNASSDVGGAFSAEDKIASEKAIAEANTRIKELEKNVNELQNLLEIKNKSLAEQQDQVEAVKAEANSPSSAVSSTPEEAAPAGKVEEHPDANTTSPSVPVDKMPPVSTAAKPKPATVPQPEPSFVDALMENPLVLPGIGALLVALGGLGIYRARRQKQGKSFEDSIISDSRLKANSLFGSTGGQSVDTNNSVFNSSFSPSASQLDTNEVDPVAEADVYIAYGRDAQAEEILKEALRTQPERHAVRVKLLEIYSNRKDLRAFEVLATELYGLTNGEGGEWEQAAALGVSIDPNNPLYAAGRSQAGDLDGESSTLVAPTQPLDEQGLATLLATTQSDTSEPLDGLDTDTGYFDNTGLAADKPLEPLSESLPSAEVEAKPQTSTNELDFDLEGMGDMTAPNTIPRPLPSEPTADMASIDFDFLDEPKAAPAESEAEGGADQSPLQQGLEPVAGNILDIPDLPPIDGLDFPISEESTLEDEKPGDISLDIGMDQPDIPIETNMSSLEDIAPEKAMPEAGADPMDFDLSGISLELSPDESAASPDFALDDQGDETSNTEMATKLDLAIAYQEIGDKEGARELLDEVLKGGTPEQSERAKSLLLELA